MQMGKVVTAIKAQVKDENRVSVFLDGKYSFSLSLEQLLESRLKKNVELDEAQISHLKKASEDGKKRQKAIEWILLRPHSSREFNDYLFRKKIDKQLGAKWHDEFVKNGLLNDEKYARWFAENRARKNKSLRAIKSELFSKGISSSLVEKVTGELEVDDNDALKKLAEKLGARPSYQDREKLKRYLVSKGFSYSEVKSVVDELGARL